LFRFVTCKKTRIILQYALFSKEAPTANWACFWDFSSRTRALLHAAQQVLCWRWIAAPSAVRMFFTTRKPRRTMRRAFEVCFVVAVELSDLLYYSRKYCNITTWHLLSYGNMLGAIWRVISEKEKSLQWYLANCGLFIGGFGNKSHYFRKVSWILKININLGACSKAEQLCQIREGFENCPRNFFLAISGLVNQHF
jgi:hypothetical protein